MQFAQGARRSGGEKRAPGRRYQTSGGGKATDQTVTLREGRGRGRARAAAARALEPSKKPALGSSSVQMHEASKLPTPVRRIVAPTNNCGIDSLQLRAPPGSNCIDFPGLVHGSSSTRVSTFTFNQTKLNNLITLKVTLREAQRLNSTHTCSVVVPGCTDNFFWTGHTPPSRRPFLEEVVNDRGKYSIEFNVNVYLNLH